MWGLSSSQAERQEGERVAASLNMSASELESAHEEISRKAASVIELESKLALKQAENDSLQDKLHATAMLHEKSTIQKERLCEEREREQKLFDETLRQARDAGQAEVAIKEKELAQTTAVVTRLQAELTTSGTIEMVFAMDEARCALWCVPGGRPLQSGPLEPLAPFACEMGVMLQ